MSQNYQMGYDPSQETPEHQGVPSPRRRSARQMDGSYQNEMIRPNIQQAGNHNPQGYRVQELQGYRPQPQQGYRDMAAQSEYRISQGYRSQTTQRYQDERMQNGERAYQGYRQQPSYGDHAAGQGLQNHHVGSAGLEHVQKNDGAVPPSRFSDASPAPAVSTGTPMQNVVVNVNTVTEVSSYESFFDGKLSQQIGYILLGALVTMLTLGICYPWALCKLYGWKIKHTVINGKRLAFDGKATQLLGKWILWLLLCLVTLGIYSFWVGIALERWKTKHTHFTK